MPVGGLLSLQLIALRSTTVIIEVFVCFVFLFFSFFFLGGGGVTYSNPTDPWPLCFWGLIPLGHISFLLSLKLTVYLKHYLPLDCNHLACILCTITALIFPNMYHLCYLSLINIYSYYETLYSVTLRVNDNLSAYHNDKQCLCNEYDNLHGCLMTRPPTSGQCD